MYIDGFSEIVRKRWISKLTQAIIKLRLEILYDPSNLK